MPSPKIAPETVNVADLAEAIRDAVAANQAPRKITYGEFMARKPKRVMPFSVVHNGIELSAAQLTPEAIALLPKLQAGKFFNRLITVRGSVERGFTIDYPNRSVDDRMRIESYSRGDFAEMLQRLTTETPDLS